MTFFDRLRGAGNKGPVRSRKIWAVTSRLLLATRPSTAVLSRHASREPSRGCALHSRLWWICALPVEDLSIQRASDNQVDKARLVHCRPDERRSPLLGARVNGQKPGPCHRYRHARPPRALDGLAGCVPAHQLGSLCCYLLYQTVEHTRLLDLYEIVARIFSLTAAALVLVVMDGVSVIWISSFSDYPVHATFQIFLASLLFLGLYDPLRDRIETVAGEWFNRPGRRLELTLREIDRSMTKVISLTSLDRSSDASRARAALLR